MNRKRLSITGLLVLAIGATWLLISGAPVLGARLPGGLPVGNALAALVPCAMAGAALNMSTRNSLLRIASLAALIAALLWLPVSIALAGNLDLNFSGERGAVWLGLTAAVILIAGAVLLWAMFAEVIAKARAA